MFLMSIEYTFSTKLLTHNIGWRTVALTLVGHRIQCKSLLFTQLYHRDFNKSMETIGL